jgi:23S rRNA pseudouridine1911/1915/1917 synthase
MSDDELTEFATGESLDVIVPGSLAGVRIDRAVAMLTGLSRNDVTKLIGDGRVTVDGRLVTKSSISLVENQRLFAALPEDDDGIVRADATVPVDVILEDEHFVVVNKAADQVVHPGAGRSDGTLVAGIAARYPEVLQLAINEVCEPLRPGVVHRLDKGTSGLLVFARTEEGFYSLSEQLADRSMGRTYIGLVEGDVTEERGVVDAPIGRSIKVPTMMAVKSDGRPARTGYEVIQRLSKPRALTLLRLRLETGRTHQIRVHLSAIGHPVLNDTRYGQRRDKRLHEERFFLHSETLSFDHPVTGERITTQVDLPSDLASLITTNA